VASRAVINKYIMIAAGFRVKLKAVISFVGEGGISWPVLLIRRKLGDLNSWRRVARKMEFRSLWRPRRVY